MKPMKQIIGGKAYDTETATKICELYCSDYPSDFRYHNTAMYRTKRGTYFVAGHGGPMSMWRAPAVGGGWTDGHGIRVVEYEEARETAENAGLDVDEMIAAGFQIEEG